jgi:hypothetical protein
MTCRHDLYITQKKNICQGSMNLALKHKEMGTIKNINSIGNQPKTCGRWRCIYVGDRVVRHVDLIVIEVITR